MKNIKRKIISFIFIFTFALVLSGCGAKKYELSFEMNGGTSISSVTIDNKTSYSLPNPTREGYLFEGWYLNSDFSGDKLTEITINSNTKVYAKWEQLFSITLDTNGGTLSTTTVYGKSGDNIYDLVKDLVPTKSGVVFGAWFNGTVELSPNTKLTNKNITLTAKYKVEYTINLYTQKISLDGYDKEEIKEYAYEGKTISYSLDNDEGFIEVEKEDSVDEIVISSNPSSNVLTLYYDREEYTITLRSNYPYDKNEETKVFKLYYGQEVDLPDVDFECDGYYLAGFALSTDSEMIYNAHTIDNLCVNAEEVVVVKDKVSANRSMSLYAVWNKGYRDMFGGDDYIFIDSENRKVYLSRTGTYFVGDYFKNDNSFIFYNDKENLEGRFFNDGTFAYYNSQRDEYSATLYKVGSGLDNNVKILFDPYNGITYHEQVETEGSLLPTVNQSKGTYTIDENGYYIATLTEGPRAGETMVIATGKVTIDNVTSNAFQLRNEEEYNMGILVRFAIYNGQFTYYTQAFQMTLSGFGTLAYNNGSSIQTYYYTYDKEANILDITNSNGQSVGIAKISEFNGTKGYMFYDKDLDNTYTDADGSTLKLDGLCEATYKKGDTSIKGYYTIKSSAFGGNIVTLTSNGETYIFITNKKTEEKTVEGEGESTVEEVTIYSFERKPKGYAEYYHKDAQSIYYAPLIVLNDKEEGKANVYGYTSQKTYELILEGTYTLDENTNLYVFTTLKSYDTEVITSPYDISTFTRFVFDIDTKLTNYSINYFYETTVGENTTSYKEEYTNTDGSSLVLVSGIAILKKDGYIVVGTYETKNNVTTITSRNQAAYVELNDGDKSFIVLDFKPYNAYIVMEDGSSSTDEYLSLDGKGGAEYVFYTTEGEERVKHTYTGTATDTNEKTKEGYTIYEFVSNEKTFKYLSVVSQSNTFILPYYGKYYGSYTSDDGILYLDGYAYYASYTDKDGNEYLSVYFVTAENEIRLVINEKYRYFDINERSFTIRGAEFGTYIVMDNQGTPGLFIDIDGYGKASVFKLEDGVDGKVFIDENATYEMVDDKFTVSYKESSSDLTLIGYLGKYTYKDTTYNTFIVEHTEAVQTFVNMKDWSVLKLDQKGNAIKVDSKGNKMEGSYMLITDNLLYFASSDNSDANIFKYNTTNGTITESKFSARGYYTEDLKSLLFSQYGFAIFNNETRYYYTMDGDDVIIYHQDASNPNANKYGFISENFGEFEDVKVYNGETYYQNDGYAITFTRKEETKDKYPVLVDSNTDLYAPIEELVFTPSGSDTFRVTGSVKVNNQNVDCYVTREYVEDHYEMYVSVGYYRFYITAKYVGKNPDGSSNSKYEVTGLSFIREFYPYQYLNNFYIYYLFFGAQFASEYENDLGMLSLIRTFDENGDQVDDYMKVEFMEGSKAYDLDGNLLGVEKGPYAYENNLYSISMAGSDGYTYKLYFTLQNHQAYGSQMYGYRIYAVTRLEILTYNDYTVEIERIIVTEYNYNPGTYFSITLKNGEEEVSHTEAFEINGVMHYVSRVLDDDNKITSTTYYKLSLTEKDLGTLDEKKIAPFESVVVTPIVANTIYDNLKTSYIDVLDGKVVFIQIKASKYTVTESEYDDSTKTYTITLSSSRKYTVKIDDNGEIIITEIKEESNE